MLGGTQAIARDFHVKDFGAKGDGKTDDGPAIRRALAAAIKASPGSKVIFEKKKYYLDKSEADHQLTISNVDGLQLIGNGAELLNNLYNGVIAVVDSKNITFAGFYMDCDPQENIDWFNYCNATEGPMAELRKSNGYTEPLNVKFWSVGNERYDKEYVDRVRDTAKAMKASDSTVQITCSGSQDGGGIESYLMETAGDFFDYVSVHNYWLDRGKVLPRHDYLTAISKSEMPGVYMESVIDSLIKEGRGNLKIAFDEWNLRAWQHPGFPRDAVDNYDDLNVRSLVKQREQENDLAEQYTMADALFSASFFNACLRNSEHLTMANIAPLVNTRGPLFVHPEGIVKRTHFHTMSMYANLLQSQVAESVVTSDILSGTSVSTIDGIATVDQSGKQWSIALVNRHPSEHVDCAVNMNTPILDGTYKAMVLKGDSPDSYNDIEHPDRVMPKETQLVFNRGTVSLEPHSLTIVYVSAEK